ncbi:MAG: glycosyltransferase [Candidatus Altiarchaeales archaeon]|nr:glycosyltransferase [Candidatus Altiarchaeales archaeon]MBD3417079.1 glycosyltransferase [Candidatus Altiarchaeales archaeon]
MNTIVMLPTYNERENIRGIIEAVLEQDPSLEVLVVDDSSPDGTGEIVDRMASEDPRVHIIHRKERGRGTAGLRGFKWAVEKGYDYLVEMDSDFSHDPEVIKEFLKEIVDCDVVVGSRYVEGGGAEGWSPIRKLISGVANAYARALLGLKLRDCTGGFKMFRVEVLKSLDLEGYRSDRNIYDGPETLLRIARKGFRMKEIPITFRERAAGKSKITFNKILRNILNHLNLRLKVGGA